MSFENNETYLLVCFLLPFIAVISSAVIKFANLRELITVSVAAALFINMLNVLDIFRGGHNFSYNLIEILPGINIAFEIEPLGMIFALIISFLWIVSTIYSIGYMRGNNESNQGRFFSFFALAIFSSIGVAFADNLLTLFVFYELLTVCTFPLVAHSGTQNAKKSGRVYLGIIMGTSIMFLLPAIILTYITTGTLDFTSGGILDGDSSVIMSSLLLFLFVYGIGKAAVMPIHKWLPAAMVAPTPVSALLHAVAVVKAGVFSLVKVVVYIFGVDYIQGLADINWWSGQWLSWGAAFTVIVASLVALKQDSIKKMLAYSTISQLSYVVLAVSILAPKSIMAAAFHIVAHSFGKITLFFAAGSIYTTAKKSKISEISGIGKQMPITMIAFSIGALSMIGIPPAVGFISKWYMIEGAFSRELYWIIGVIIISTLLNCTYFLPVIYKAFFKEEKVASGVVIPNNHGESSFPIVVAMFITAMATIGLFIYPGVFMELAKAVVN